MTHRASAAAGGQRTLLGHPRGLAVLSGTQMWERFGFYGLQSILVLFLMAPAADNGLGLDATAAIPIASVYTGLAFLTALPGGWLADRVLGARRAVLAGGLVVAAGHLVLALPIRGLGAAFAGLFLVVAGSGLLRPNIAVMAGRLYRGRPGARRDAGFSLFFMAVNLGALVGVLLAPYLVGGDRWHLAFGAGALGMGVGVLWYVRGWPRLKGTGVGPSRPLDARDKRRIGRMLLWAALIGAVAVAVWGLTGTMTLRTVPTAVTVLSVAGAAGYFVRLFSSGDVTRAERAGLRAYAALFCAAVVFFTLVAQTGTVLTEFADSSVDLRAFGSDAASGRVQNLGPIYVVVFAPVFALIWIKAGDRVGAARKFAGGLAFASVAYVLLGWLQGRSDDGVLVALGWMALVYLLLAFGELALAPVGMSVTVQLAPEHLKGQMMGVWFLAPAVGAPLGGQVYAFLAPRVGETGFFFTLAAFGAAAAAVLFAAAPRLGRLMASD